MVQVADPGVNPQNLAAAQEMSAGIYRLANTETLTNVELWVDDIRLDAPLSRFVDVEVPPLPPDPASAGASLDAVLVLVPRGRAEQTP